MNDRITARKYMGDDQGSWAVFLNGRPMYTGLTRSEVPYYKRLVARGAKRIPQNEKDALNK